MTLHISAANLLEGLKSCLLHRSRCPALLLPCVTSSRGPSFLAGGTSSHRSNCSLVLRLPCQIPRCDIPSFLVPGRLFPGPDPLWARLLQQASPTPAPGLLSSLPATTPRSQLPPHRMDIETHLDFSFTPHLTCTKVDACVCG